MTLETHFTWCITKGASYHGSLNGVGWNVWEKSQFKVELSLSCKSAVSTVLFWEKYITINISICASNLLKQESSARWFSPSARPLLLWFVVLSRHGVMASATYWFSPYSQRSFRFSFQLMKNLKTGNNSCNLYYDTITSHGWNIRLRNILGSIQKWAKVRGWTGNRSLTSERITKRRRPSNIWLFVSFTKHKKRIRKRRSVCNNVIFVALHFW